MSLAVILWATDAFPFGVVAIICPVLLLVTRAVPTMAAAIRSFATPTPYFLISVLAIGLVIHKSGLSC